MDMVPHDFGTTLSLSLSLTHILYRSTTPADEDRDKAYTLAEILNTKLDDMGSQLAIVINDLNQSRKANEGGGNYYGSSGLDDSSPLESITAILNAHLASLEWIENTAVKLESKVEKLKSVQEMVMVNRER
jgi:nuclear pore complex protein Nup62